MDLSFFPCRQNMVKEMQQPRDLAFAGFRRRWKALTRARLNKPCRRESQSHPALLQCSRNAGCRREVALFMGASGSSRRGLHWMVLNRQEVPLGLCNCCAYKVFGCTMAHQCRSCHVRDGILRLIRKDQGEPIQGDELLGVC